MKLNVPSDREEILQVSSAAPANGVTMGVLSGAQTLSDELILESIVAATSGRAVSRSDAVAAVIAGKILRLQIPNGSRVVMPATGVVCRTMSDDVDFTEPLVHLRERLQTAASPSEVMKAGMQLGDRGTHMAAGFIGNRKLRKVMTEAVRARYARSMASTGYRSALSMAEKVGSGHGSMARTVSSVVPGIIERFDHIVRVLTSFHEGELEEAAQKGGVYTN